jgi:hypothetical protein
LPGAIPAQPIALYAGSEAVGQAVASPFAFLNYVVYFPCAFIVVCFCRAIKNRRVPSEMAMFLCSAEYFGKLSV